MKIKKAMELLSLHNPEAELKTHSINGNNVLFITAYKNVDNVVFIEDKEDNDLSSELDARFENLRKNNIDELEFFTDLIDSGFTLEDIKENLPDEYDYAKQFIEEHNLV